MKSIFKQFWIIFTAGTILLGCIRVPEPSPDLEGQKLVVNAFWQPDSSPVVQLGQSFGIVQKPSTGGLNGAGIQLLENGVPVSTYTGSDSGLYLPDAAVKIKAGSVYTLLVQWQDFAPVQAAVQIPALPDWKWLDSTGNEETLSILSTLSDQAGEQYYLLEAELSGTRYVRNDRNEITDSFPEKRNLPIRININNALSFDLIQLDGRSKAFALFSDLGFEEQSFVLSTGIERALLQKSADFRPDYIHLQLNSISRDYYLYLESALKNVPVYGLFTGNSVNVHSNVRNGLGILGGFHPRRISVKM